MTYSTFIIDTIFDKRHSVTFCTLVGHVQILIFILLLLLKGLLKILYIEKTIDFSYYC